MPISPGSARHISAAEPLPAVGGYPAGNTAHRVGLPRVGHLRHPSVRLPGAVQQAVQLGLEIPGHVFHHAGKQAGQPAQGRQHGIHVHIGPVAVDDQEHPVPVPVIEDAAVPRPHRDPHRGPVAAGRQGHLPFRGQRIGIADGDIGPGLAGGQGQQQRGHAGDGNCRSGLHGKPGAVGTWGRSGGDGIMPAPGGKKNAAVRRAGTRAPLRAHPARTTSCMNVRICRISSGCTEWGIV